MIIKDFKKLPQNIQIVKETKRYKKSLKAPKDHENKTNNKNLDDEENLFLSAMEGVIPLKKTTKGRDILPEKHKTENNYKFHKTNSESNYLNKFLKGEIEFEIEYTDEFIQGKVKGLDEKIFRKLKAGAYSPEAHLDLHGYTVDEAHIALIDFIKRHYFEGKRCLLIIPGRGKNSPMGRGILRESLKWWITKDPLKRVVLAFSTAQSRHGGSGAVYILLRKYKKSRGKIFWERY